MKLTINISSLIIVVWLLIISCSTSSKMPETKANGGEEVQIHFQEKFDGDLMSFYISEFPFIENYKLHTIEALGICKALIEIVNIEGANYSVTFYSENQDSTLTKSGKNIIDSLGEIEFILSLNEETHDVSVNINKGRYIGISKESKGNSSKIKIVQSVYPFSYD